VLGLGIAGGFDQVHEALFNLEDDLLHDAAAVLIRDGVVLAGVEQERLDRIKHSNKVWSKAVTFCLESANVGLRDLDYIALYSSESFTDVSLRMLHLYRRGLGKRRDARGMFQYLFEREFGVVLPREVFHFVHHHMAHAATSYYMSGYEDSLILTIDGSGDNVSTMVVDARNGVFTALMDKPVVESLGFFYLDVIRFLGYRIFDEYKVMGLAPYGDASVLRERFKAFYTLLPQGDYTINKGAILGLYEVLEPRLADEDFKQIHKDIAAALQESLEAIVFHILAHYREKTGHTRLCLAGGVAQNSSMNGKIVRSGMFAEIFAPSFAADSGCAYGAAMQAAHQLGAPVPKRPVTHAYWGSPVPANDVVERELRGWSDFVDVAHLDNRAEQVAGLISGGAVIGWVQGRSEFGPRALGNRSIIADPRLASHKETINAMIKMRESYRPFAPSVLKEAVRDFFEIPGVTDDFPFMSVVLPVRPEKREELRAITHVDGTARIQTVSREDNPVYWELIKAFGDRTGVPMLLNTSFNNHAEPIVDSVRDAMVCYVTSGLNYLVVGDWLVSKKAWAPSAMLGLTVCMSPAARLTQERRYVSATETGVAQELYWNYDPKRRFAISPEWYALAGIGDGKRPLRTLIDDLGFSAEQTERALTELSALWSARLLTVGPAPAV
jgi:carbamoyltransferase